VGGFEFHGDVLSALSGGAACDSWPETAGALPTEEAVNKLLDRLGGEIKTFFEGGLPSGESLYHALGFVTSESFQSDDEGRSVDGTVLGEYVRRYSDGPGDDGQRRNWDFVSVSGDEYKRQLSARLTSLFKSVADLRAREGPSPQSVADLRAREGPSPQSDSKWLNNAVVVVVVVVVIVLGIAAVIAYLMYRRNHRAQHGPARDPPVQNRGARNAQVQKRGKGGNADRRR
jgi:hypothetical protein